jgi:hypothetical protein
VNLTVVERRGPDSIFPRIAGLTKTRTGWLGRCPAHDDHSPSLSIRIGDDGRLLLYCFARCRIADIVAAIGLELRDLFPSSGSVPTRRPIPRARSPLDEARADVLQDARRQQRRLAPFHELFTAADSIRVGSQLATEARRVATQLGDGETTWELLGQAAAVELEVLNVEAELDQCLAEKRLPS